MCVRSYQDGEGILDGVSQMLTTRFGIYFSAIQIEQQCQAREEDAAAIDIVAAGALVGRRLPPQHHAS